MKKVLYISSIEVPYRVEFLNQLSLKCHLTVVYETKNQTSRNDRWTKSVKFNKKYNRIYLSKGKTDKLHFNLIKHILTSKYDSIIFGCINYKTPIITILIMKLLHKRYILSFDGETFWPENNKLKQFLKQFLIKNAFGYLVAGNQSLINIKKITNSNNIETYYFSSLTEKEIRENNKQFFKKRNNKILVVGNYVTEKGLDVIVKIAKMTPELNFKIIGVNHKYQEFLDFIKNQNVKDNIEIIPFLQKKDLNEEYKKCKMFVLPSRRECWGLVINEAASFGIPIVSTYGSGAAIEFLKDEYPMFLAKPGDYIDLKNKIELLSNYKDLKKYQKFLISKSSEYTIEKMVEAHMRIINKCR